MKEFKVVNSGQIPSEPGKTTQAFEKYISELLESGWTIVTSGITPMSKVETYYHWAHLAR